MPLFEYKCGECGERAEQFASVSATVQCPKCGASMTRLISVPHVKFPPGRGFTTSKHQRDIENRKVMPDGSIGTVRDYERLIRDKERTVR